jgi:hypothetical protein
VTAAWLGGMGLPDRDRPNTSAAAPRDPRLGLLLSKNGPSPECASSGARLEGVQGTVVSTTFELGFDYRNGGHCGAGAPRFNVSTRTPTGASIFHFVGGCANGASQPASQDPTQWSRVRFGLAQQFPPITPGSRIERISIVYDEGIDIPSVQDPIGVGLAVLDSIFVNGRAGRSRGAEALRSPTDERPCW